jgi:hypothetical protein
MRDNGFQPVCKESQSFDFELRGRNGDELVIITDGEDKQTAILSTDYKAFSVHNKNIVITFKNDIGQRDVFFKSSVHTDIRSDGRFSGWNCGKSNENVRCQRVRDGKFLWSGDYQITFDDNKAAIISTGPNSCDWSHQIPELHKYLPLEECALECAKHSQCKAFYLWVKNPYKSKPLCLGFSQQCSGNLVSSSCPDNAWCGYNIFRN